MKKELLIISHVYLAASFLSQNVLITLLLLGLAVFWFVIWLRSD